MNIAERANPEFADFLIDLRQGKTHRELSDKVV